MQEVIVKYNGDVTSLGYATEILNGNYAILTLPEDEISKLNGFTQIEYYELPKRLTPVRVNNLDQSCVTQVQNQNTYGLTGEGVLVAVIDSGVDYNHQCFKNSDGSSRILFIWDQTVEGTPPAGFLHGTEYSSAQINAGNIPHTDDIGHGTAVTGIAAGNSGVAPGASIIAVKLGERDSAHFARDTEIMRGIKYVYDKAQSLNMPLAVNLSYGTNNGAHDGESLFEGYINDMTENWKSVIVAASGNEGAAKHHFQHKIKQDETVDIAFTVGTRLQNLYMSVWKNFSDKLIVEFICPNGVTTGALEHTYIPKVIHLCGTRLMITYFQPNHYSIENEISYLIEAGENDEITQGTWTLRLTGVGIVDGRIDAWLPTLEETTDKVAFLVPSADTTLTIPSCAQRVITVSGYDTATGGTASFSGRGYTRENVYVKPDVAAPAVNIESCLAGGGLGSFTGTSMAAPFVTGSAALIMQWGIVKGNDPYMYGQRVKAFLRRGAKRDTAVYPNNKMGYGILCLKNTMDLIVEYNRK